MRVGGIEAGFDQSQLRGDDARFSALKLKLANDFGVLSRR
jgi:hypothetical protein